MLDFSSSISDLQLTVEVVKKDEKIEITKSGEYSGFAYIGARWDSLHPDLVKKILNSSSGDVDVDIMAVALKADLSPVCGGYDASAITYKNIKNSRLGMCRSKDDRSGADSATAIGIDPNGKQLQIDGRNEDDERAYIDLNICRDQKAKYILVTADLYSPNGATFATLKLKSSQKDGEAWLRIADASNIKNTIIDGYGSEPPTLVGADICLVDLDELGAEKGAMIGYFKLNDDDFSWSWVTKVQAYPCSNGETYAKVFKILQSSEMKSRMEAFFGM